MRILFFVEDWPLSPNAEGGAGALNYGHLKLVVNSGVEVRLVVLFRDETGATWQQTYVNRQPHMWMRVQSWVEGVTFIAYKSRKRRRAPFRHFLHSVADPLYAQSRFDQSVVNALSEVVRTFKPDVIFCLCYSQSAVFLMYQLYMGITIGCGVLSDIATGVGG